MLKLRFFKEKFYLSLRHVQLYPYFQFSYEEIHFDNPGGLRIFSPHIGFLFSEAQEDSREIQGQLLDTDESIERGERSSNKNKFIQRISVAFLSPQGPYLKIESSTQYYMNSWFVAFNVQHLALKINDTKYQMFNWRPEIGIFF